MSSKKVSPIKPAVRTVVLEGNVLRLAMDFNAMYAYEQLTGKNLFDALNNLDESAPLFTRTAQLLYCLSQSSREDDGNGDMSFKSFLRILPPANLEEFNRLTQMAMAVVTETLGVGGDAAGNGQTPPQ